MEKKPSKTEKESSYKKGYEFEKKFAQFMKDD